MTCNHPTHMLTGTALGVTCRACGKVFTPDEYRAFLHPPDPGKTKTPRKRKEAAKE